VRSSSFATPIPCPTMASNTASVVELLLGDIKPSPPSNVQYLHPSEQARYGPISSPYRRDTINGFYRITVQECSTEDLECLLDHHFASRSHQERFKIVYAWIFSLKSSQRPVAHWLSPKAYESPSGRFSTLSLSPELRDCQNLTGLQPNS
jgi:hypothetical protein